MVSYLVIHQYDAHAWVEVYLEGKGGWVCVDPTSLTFHLWLALRPGFGMPLKRRVIFEKMPFQQVDLHHIGVISWLRWQLDAVTITGRNGL